MATGGIVVSAGDTSDPHRRWLDVVFALFLASGVMVGAYSLWAIADWVHSQGEGAFGMLYIGMYSFVPTVLALLAGGGYTLLAARNRDVRLGLALTSAHLVWWLLVIGVKLWRDDPSWGWVMRVVTIVEPALYAVGITCLAARGLWWRRRHGPEGVAAS
jgi:hypothetical protein